MQCNTLISFQIMLIYFPQNITRCLHKSWCLVVSYPKIYQTINVFLAVWFFPVTERFPYVNFAMFQGDDSKVMDDFINPGPELMAALIDAHGPPGHQINFPGNSYMYIHDTCIAFNFPRKNSTTGVYHLPNIWVVHSLFYFINHLSTGWPTQQSWFSVGPWTNSKKYRTLKLIR